MAITHAPRAAFAALVVLSAAVALVGCTDADASTPTPAASESGSALGELNEASGDPIVFGMINIESGPVTFPEVAQASQAAASYVNDYLGGIGGRPIKIVSCVTDGQPATSQRCANQILDENPVAILGGADIGGSGAFEVWDRADLAYLGGAPLTPAEQTYDDSVIFSSVSTGDNAAAVVYAYETLGARTGVVIYTSDTQGTHVTEDIIVPTMENVGFEEVTKVGVPPTASDVSSAVATAVGAGADLIYVNAPAACPNVLSTLKQLGNTAKLMGIEPCTSPDAIAGANGGAEGLMLASPVLDPAAGTEESDLFLAAREKYAPDLPLDSLAVIGFQTVINVQAALNDIAPEDLTTETILAAFRDGSDHANFMGHPYTCDGEQLAGAPAICNAYQQIRKIEDGKQVVADEEWVTAGDFYVPVAH